MVIKRFYKIQELSEYLGVEVSTLYGWVHTRQIPYYKIGRLRKTFGLVIAGKPVSYINSFGYLELIR